MTEFINRLIIVLPSQTEKQNCYSDAVVTALGLLGGNGVVFRNNLLHRITHAQIKRGLSERAVTGEIHVYLKTFSCGRVYAAYREGDVEYRLGLYEVIFLIHQHSETVLNNGIRMIYCNDEYSIGADSDFCYEPMFTLSPQEIVLCAHRVSPGRRLRG